MDKNNLEVLLEDIRGKFELVLEEPEVLRKEIRDTREYLSEKIKFVDFKINGREAKFVMPDLIRHPVISVCSGFRLPPE